MLNSASVFFCLFHTLSIVHNKRFYCCITEKLLSNRESLLNKFENIFSIEKGCQISSHRIFYMAGKSVSSILFVDYSVELMCVFTFCHCSTKWMSVYIFMIIVCVCLKSNAGKYGSNIIFEIVMSLIINSLHCAYLYLNSISCYIDAC